MWYGTLWVLSSSFHHHPEYQFSVLLSNRNIKLACVETCLFRYTPKRCYSDPAMKLRYLRVTTDRDRTVEGEANELTHSSKYLDLGRGAHGSSKARALNRQLAYDQVT